MKKITLYLFLVAICLAVAGVSLVILRDNVASTGSIAADRVIAAAARVSQPLSDRLIYSLQERLRVDGDNPRYLVQLAAAYMQKARETGDSGYYNKTEMLLQKAVKLNADDADALVLMGTLCLARHEFLQALAWGRRAGKANPSKAAAFGVMGDASLELGQYEQAFAFLQKMVDLRPDLSSYSRISYGRELIGDMQGAIAAMQMAVAAGGPAMENTNWCRVQLGDLYFNTGNLSAAEAVYTQALLSIPDYAPALFGIAKVKTARGDRDEAIAILEKIVARMPMPEYIVALGDLYAMRGSHEQARQQYALVQTIQRLSAANGVQIDMELALFLADHDLDLPQALAHARKARQMRPSITAADALAWVLHKNGRDQEAAQYAMQALRLGTCNPILFFHAGMIFYHLGDWETAKKYLQKALAMNPYFSPRYAPEASKILTLLNGTESNNGHGLLSSNRAGND